jgi:hypothetical protein
MVTLMLMAQLGASGGLTFTLGDVVKFLGVAFMFGTLVQQVRSLAKIQKESDARHNKAIEKLELRQEKLEDRFAGALEHLGDSLDKLSDELRGTLTDHEARIRVIEKD